MWGQKLGNEDKAKTRITAAETGFMRLTQKYTWKDYKIMDPTFQGNTKIQAPQTTTKL
jgi:hypothetical protein